MTFSKKMLSGGIFTKSSMRPAQAGRIINTWVGDPHKILMLEAVSYFKLLCSYIHTIFTLDFQEIFSFFIYQRLSKRSNLKIY